MTVFFDSTPARTPRACSPPPQGFHGSAVRLPESRPIWTKGADVSLFLTGLIVGAAAAFLGVIVGYALGTYATRNPPKD